VKGPGLTACTVRTTASPGDRSGAGRLARYLHTHLFTAM
jgi:hypothetical protein